MATGSPQKLPPRSKAGQVFQYMLGWKKKAEQAPTPHNLEQVRKAARLVRDMYDHYADLPSIYLVRSRQVRDWALEQLRS